MFKRIFIIAAVLLLIGSLFAWFFATFVSRGAVAASAARDWPHGLGSLEAVASRYPAQAATPAAQRLLTAGAALAELPAIDRYVQTEIERGETTIAAPPSLPDLSDARSLLLREEVVWGRPGGVGDIGGKETTERRAAQMRLARALIASALAQARASDPAAWETLHAVRNLARSIDPQPEMMEQTAAFSMLRMVNAVSWKMPAPAPSWLGELQRYDPLPRLLEAYQYQTAAYWQDARVLPTTWHAEAVEHDRQIAIGLSQAKRCDAAPPMNTLGADLSSLWQRVFRYRAEREAAANAWRLRRGEAIVSSSACAEATWKIEGRTLTFSGPITKAPGDRAMPLTLQLSAEPKNN